jgi:hypothetical protein
MKRAELEARLRAARAPARDPAYWAEFPAAVLRRIEARRMPAEHPRPRRRTAAWIAAAAAAAAGLCAGYFLWGRPGLRAETYVRLRDGQALREALPLYLGRLQAIEQDGDGLRLVLSPRKDVPASLPVWVEVGDGRDRRALDTFSGQSFRFRGEDIEVLADPDGQVLLVGPGFVWSNRGAAAGAGGLQAAARVLPSDPMEGGRS